jgi:predicted dehydrogenase/nucleoside-diphosphate-sugar epimerase
VGLVGAGNIARVHAEALRRLPGVTISAIIDPNETSARALASWLGGAPAIFPDAEAAITAAALDCAHVLTPPDLHASVAGALLRARLPVLVEKPLATDTEDCDALIAAAATSGVTLGVNQNFVHHPAFARLRRMVEAGTLGRPRSVSCIYNAALRQLAARQFGHWMFHAPGNILLEQAVHPLSQIAALAGPIGDFRAVAGPSVPIGDGQRLQPTLDALLTGRDLPAQLRFVVGATFPFWQVTVVCDDGVGVADILANRVLTYGRTRWLEPVDAALSGLASGGGILRDSIRNAVDYGGSTLRLRPGSDPFYRSMLGSIGAFHAALDAGQTPELDGAFGRMLVDVCERMAADTYPAAPITTAVPAPANDTAGRPAAAAPDVVVLGGTGFIGSYVVRAFLDAGHSVRVMARSTRNLPPLYADPRVTVTRGDIRDADSVRRAVEGMAVVVNLAHGGGGADFAAIRAAMVGGAETVARACLASGTSLLLHIGSIASLYLGPQPTPITGQTPPDLKAEQRADYARAKAEADRMLLELHARDGLPVCILRPGLVVGEGTSPLHSGIGFYNNDQHCVGWNDGRNKLPFILAEDVASAIAAAAARPETVIGRCYNLVGDVRPTAREYIESLGRVLGRPLRYHPQSARGLWMGEVGKWLVKRAGGRKSPMPSQRDILSRGLVAQFDCTDAKTDLGWSPISDPAVFEDRAIRPHVA